MATAELISEEKPETELTATLPITSDQDSFSADLRLTDIPSPTAQNSSSTQAETPSCPPDTKSPEPSDTATCQKDTDEITHVKCPSPKVCQQVEEEGEEISNDTHQHPRIDAVWSIGEEHSYEQKPAKRKKKQDVCPENNGTHFVQQQMSAIIVGDATSDQGTEKGLHQAGVKPMPKMPFLDNHGSDLVKARTAHVPQILKIQTKASKKYLIQDSSDPNAKQTKYLTLHSTKSHTVPRSYKSLKVLQLPSTSHGSSHSSWNSCLIDHNLKPLQIQHNLENKKNKSLAVLKLETFSLKYQEDSEQSMHYPYPSEPTHPPTSHFPGREHSNTYMLNKDPVTAAYIKTEEVGPESVYLDVDADPNTSFDFPDNEDMNGMKTGDSVDSMMEQCNLQNLSMDQYLPDFSDLPQFQNIPMDIQDDPCAEPTQLNPSIDHSLLDYDWPPCDTTWYNPVPTLTTTTNPPTTTTTASLPDSFSGFVEKGIQDNEILSSGGGVDGVITTFTTSNVNNLSMLSQLQSSTSTATASVTSASIMSTHIKSEEQRPWNETQECGQAANNSCSTQPVTGTEEAGTASCMSTDGEQPQNPDTSQSLNPDTSQSLNPDTSQSLNPDNPISRALMTALDMDSHNSSLMELQSSTTAGPDNHTDYPYTDPNLGMACSSTFLSPPPSVEQQASQRSTPCLDNESGYMTMEEQELPSPGNMYWKQQHYPATVSEDTDSSYTQGSSNTYPGNMTSGYGEVGGYPYTHQDSHHQTLHQTASCSMTSSNTNTTNSNKIIYYPFSDLMQLNPSLLSSDPEMSVQYVHPNTYSQNYPQQTLCDAYPDQAMDQTMTQTYLHQHNSARKRGRGGRPRGGQQTQMGQIQSDQITSSLQRQLQVQGGPQPKRQYKRRNPDAKKKPMTPRVQRCSSVDGAEKKGRHNEPLNQRAVDIMYDWYREHEENPYPSKEEKERMAVEGGITTMQVKSWFANKRNRSNNTRPKVQKRAMEEKLMQIYNQLSKTEGASIQDGGNSFIIKELSQIIHNKLETDMPVTPESTM